MKALVATWGKAAQSHFEETTQIPVCRLFLAITKDADAKRGFRDTPNSPS